MTAPDAGTPEERQGQNARNAMDENWQPKGADLVKHGEASMESRYTPDPTDELARLAEASKSPEDFWLVYRTLMASYDSSCRMAHMTAFADEVAALAVSALVATGRLADPNAETRTEWASEHSGHGAANFPDPLIFETGSDRRLAEVRVETWRTSHPSATHRLLSRQVTTTRGPWLPAPADTKES